MVLECLWVLVLVNGPARAACAMGVRALLQDVNVTQSPVALISPVSPRHSNRANPALVVAIVVLMLLATAALVCCCFQWERQLRLRIDAARTSAAQHPHAGPQMGSSPSVIVLLGEDVTRSAASAVPRRISMASDAVATHATATKADQSFGKLAPA